MTKAELLTRLSAHEDNFVERKSEGMAAREIRKTIAAFANTVDGREAVLFVGVQDRGGAITGVTDTDALQKRVREACEDCYPSIKYSCEVLQHEGKSVVAVVVPPSNDKPHFTGPAFVRVGSQSVQASKEQFDEIILSRNDKCREILRLKGKTLITVRGIGYKLGSHKPPLADPRYVEQTECRVVDCTAHTVTLFEPASGREFSESLAGVVIARDDAHLGRLMLLVHFPRP